MLNTLPVSVDYIGAESGVRIDVETMETYIERLIRKYILKSYVEPEHPVLVCEENLVLKSTLLIREEVFNLAKSSGYHPKIVIAAAISKMKKSARMMVQLHEIDEEEKELVLSSVEAEITTTITEPPTPS